MGVAVGINGFGRMGRPALRAMWDRDDLRVVHINEPHADATTCAHLLTFDSVHGRFAPEARWEGDALVAGDRRSAPSGAEDPAEVDRGQAGVRLVLECSGRRRTPDRLERARDGIAVRVPLLNASLTDCVFEMSRNTHGEEVNGLLADGASGPPAGILGYEERPLVSADFRGDARSAVVDAPSTMVAGGAQG
jgi:glyceraldehyde-3-phosphate dehydrogenase/erythrose-4-phosphate dehydrogenase